MQEGETYLLDLSFPLCPLPSGVGTPHLSFSTDPAFFPPQPSVIDQTVNRILIQREGLTPSLVLAQLVFLQVIRSLFISSFLPLELDTVNSVIPSTFSASSSSTQDWEKDLGPFHELVYLSLISLPYSQPPIPTLKAPARGRSQSS